MKNKENIDVNKAWDTLYCRLQNEQLIQNGSQPQEYSIKYPRRVYLWWAAAILILCFGGLTIVHLKLAKKEIPYLAISNADANVTLVKTLKDGSTIFLNGKSTLLVPDKFEQNQRIVTLKGNALFNIAKDSQRPFIVKTEGGIVEVLGTVFRIKSFASNGFELFVEEGLVKVSEKGNSRQMLVKAGEGVIMQNGEFREMQVSEIPVSFYQMGRLRFKDEKLENIIHAISSISSQKIVLTDQSLNDRVLTLTFDESTANAMVDLICMALNMKQTDKQGVIYLEPIE